MGSSGRAKEASKENLQNVSEKLGSSVRIARQTIDYLNLGHLTTRHNIYVRFYALEKRRH